MKSFNELNRHLHDDPRIRLAKYAGFIALAASIVITMLSSSIPMSKALYCSFAYTGFYLVNMLGFVFLRKDKASLLLYAIFSLYLWVTYILKFSLILYKPQLFLGIEASPQALSPFIQSAVSRFLVLVPALSLFIIGLCVGPGVKNQLGGNEQLPGAPRYGVLVTGVLLLISLKLIGQVVFDVGSPTKMGHGLPSLILAGYELLVQNATIVVLNVLLFTLLYMRFQRGLVIVSLAVLFNVLMSLSVGWKSQMVVQAFALLYYFIGMRQRLSLKIQRRFFAASVVLFIFMLVVYPYVNYFRQASSRGLDVESAIEKAQIVRSEKDETFEGSGAYKLFERLGGIGTYFTILELGEGERFPVLTLLGNDFGNLVKYSLYGAGADDVMVQFSATQFGAFYLVGGVTGLYVGSFLLASFIRFATSMFSNVFFRYTTTFHATIPLLAYTWLTVLVGGGRFDLKFKELFVVISMVVIVERLAFRRGRGMGIAIVDPQSINADDLSQPSRILGSAKKSDLLGSKRIGQ